MKYLIFLTILLSTSCNPRQTGAVQAPIVSDSILCSYIRNTYFSDEEEVINGLPLATLIYPTPNLDSVYEFIRRNIDKAELEAVRRGDSESFIYQLYVVDDSVACVFSPDDKRSFLIEQLIKDRFIVRSYRRSGQIFPSRLSLLINLNKL